MALKLSGTNWKKKKFSSDNNTSPELVETGSDLLFDYDNPWKIKKKITQQHLHQKNLLISSSETFDYILPYLKLDVAKELVKGNVGDVRIWDVMKSNDPNKYENGSITFGKLPNHDDCSLSIVELFNVHRLEVDDEIALYWNPMYKVFMFKLLSMIWRKKKFSYNLISSKAEVEVNSTPQVELIETGPVVKIHPTTIMWHMRKKITRENLAFGGLRISFLETFEYILPYWKLELATSLVNGNVVCVNLWIVLEQNVIHKYEGGSFRFRKLRNDDYSLSCKTLINNCGLSVGDEIGIYWDPMVSKFIFKVISKVRDSIRPE